MSGSRFLAEQTPEGPIPCLDGVESRRKRNERTRANRGGRSGGLRPRAAGYFRGSAPKKSYKNAIEGVLVAGVGHDPTTSGLYPFGYKWFLFEKITLVLMYFENIFRIFASERM